MSRLVLIRFFVVLFAVVSVTATHAQDPDGQSPTRGFQPNGAYALSDIESISLAGGNMVYSLPLAALPASRGGRLKPTVHLRYNSKLFNTQVRMCLGPNCTFTYVQTDLIPSTFGGWTYGTHYFVLTTNRATNYVDAVPPPWNQYKFKTEIFFPDGSSHQLRPSSQAETDEYYAVSPASPGTTRTYYTTDGSYLRVEFSTDGASWTIYFPNGSTVNFNNSTGVQTTTDGNGNFYTTQNVTLPNGNPATVITDQLNRKITIEKPVSGPHYVRVNGFGGTELVTTINWGTTNPQGKKWLWKEFVDEGISHYKTSVSVRPIITSINLPNGLSYQFEYNSNVFDPLNPTKSVGWGELFRTTLPTGAVVQYAYSMDNRHGNETDDIIEPKYIMWDHPTSKQLSYTDSYDGVNTPRTENWTYAVNIIEGGPAEGQTPSATAGSPDQGVTSEHFFVNLTGQTNFGKAGLSYKSIGPDGSRVERHWQENTPHNGSGNTKNFYVKTEFISIPDVPSGALVKTAIKDYIYDKNGNVTQVAEYDWVPHGDVARDADGKPTGAIPPSAQLKRVTASGFYNQTPTADSSAYHAAIYNLSTAPNLRKAAQWSEVRSGFAASSALSRVEFDYDDPNTKGNLTTTRTWDSNKGARTDPLNASNSISTSTQYNAYGSPTLTTDARLTQTQIIYDAVGGFTDLYPTSIKTAYQTPLQLTQTREYDFNTAVVTKVIDVDNNVSTSTVYDVFGRPTLVKAAEGKPEEVRTTTEYSDTLRRVIVKSDLNVIGDGKLVGIRHYDQLGRLRLSRQLEDSASESATDETTGVKVQTRYHYSLGNSFQLVSNAYRAATSGAAGSEQTMGWARSKMDVAGRAVEVQTFGGATLPSPWGTNSNSTGTVSTTYNANFTTATDQAGKLRRSMVDGLGRLVRVDEPDTSNNLGSFTSPIQPTTYGYDALGSLVSVNQGVQNRYFMYDSLKRLIRARNPEQGTHTNLNLTDPITGNGTWSIGYEYDPNGNLTEKTDARNVVSTYEYDFLNRNTEIDHSDTSVDPDVSRFYDGATNGKGRLWYSFAGGNDTVGSDVEKTLFSSYDALGRPLVLQQRFKLNNAWVPQTYQVTQGYDLGGGVISQIYPSGNSVTYNYDNAGRLADKDAQNLAFTGNLGGVSRTYSRGISYASGGQLKQEQFGTTTPVYNKLFYNSRQQLAEILASTTGSDNSWNRGKILNQYSLQCSGAGCNASDNNGNLRKQEVLIPANDQVTSYTSWYQQYDYDELNRLKRVHEYTGTPSLDWQQEFDYDRWGNRTLSATGTWVGNQNNPPNPLLNEMQYDTGAFASANRLYAPGDLALAENQRRMRYDAVGNLINDTYTGAGERVYDAENRMTKAWGGTSQWQYYTYNADGQRTRRKIDNTETWQIYGFDGELLAEYAANGAVDQPQKEYGYRNGQLLVSATPSSDHSLSLNGSSAYVQVPNSSSLNISGAITVEAWVKVNSIGVYQDIISRESYGQAGTGGGYGLTVTNLGKARIDLYHSPTTYTPVIGNTTMSTGQWHHIAGVWDGVYLKVYLNGNLDGTVTTGNGPGSGTSSVKIGRNSGGAYFNGLVDEVRVSNTAVYTSNFTPQTHLTASGSTKGLWKFDNQSPNDASTNGNHGTLQGGATYSNDVPGGGGGGGSGVGTQVQWLVSDHLGSPRMVFDQTGSLANVKRHDYLPFGEELIGLGLRGTTVGYSGVDGLRQQFTSYERDNETDLDYAHARYFSSISGRFSSPDPYVIFFAMNAGRTARERQRILKTYISEPRNWNLYAYCVNDPVNLIDPLGLIWLTKDNEHYTWVDDDKYRKEDWEGYTEVKPGTIVFFGEGWGGYEDKYKNLVGHYVRLEADGTLSDAGITPYEEERIVHGAETFMQMTKYYSTLLPDLAPAYVQLEIDAPGPPVPAGPAFAFTLDRNGNFYTSGGVYGGTPGFNVSLGWLSPNESAEGIENFLTGHSVGGSVMSPYWVGGGVTRASGKWSPQVMGGTPGVSGSYLYTRKRANLGPLW